MPPALIMSNDISAALVCNIQGPAHARPPGLSSHTREGRKLLRVIGMRTLGVDIVILKNRVYSVSIRGKRSEEMKSHWYSDGAEAERL